MRCVIEIPDDMMGHVIGKEGRQLKEITRTTGVQIKMQQQGALLEGSEMQIERAKETIQSIIRSRQMTKRTVRFPAASISSVIGERGVTIRSIKRKTNTKIHIEDEGNGYALANICGFTEGQCNEAEQKILQIVSNSPQESFYKKTFKKSVFVDGAYVGEDNEFQLEAIDDFFYHKMQVYKLIMLGDKPSQSQQVEYMSLLKTNLLEVLRDIRKENEESNKNLRTDMWCHFGHVYLYNVDEGDDAEVYPIKTIIKNLQTNEDERWSTFFKEGVEALEFNDLEKALSERPYKVQPNTRFDYTFRCPSGRQVRFKAFALESSSYDNGISFQKAFVPMKNVLATLSTESIQYYLCAPSTIRLKVDIVFPYLKFDCHLIIRTTLKETTTVRNEEEDKILSDFLDDNLKLEDGQLELPDELPEGFCITYRRRTKRKTYPYTSSKSVDFNVTISEEESQEFTTEASVRRKTDIHLHCDEWDKLLYEDDWEPEAIARKLPEFLMFLREVQDNINLGHVE